MNLHTAPAWVVMKVDQRQAELKAKLPKDLDLGEHSLIATMLVEPKPGATEEEIEEARWTCNNCGQVADVNDEFALSSAEVKVHGIRVVFTIGSCMRCKDAA